MGSCVSKVAQSPEALRDSPCSGLRGAGFSDERPDSFQLGAELGTSGDTGQKRPCSAPEGSMKCKVRKASPPDLELWDTLLDSMDLAEVVVKRMQSSPRNENDRGLAEPTSQPTWMPPSPRGSTMCIASDLPGPEIWD